jgi:UDP-2,3-diacylglucosamine pyrophosphatase LpxH
MLKQNVKKAINFINSFEFFLVKHTKEVGCSGVICGHIHCSAAKTIDGIQYFNCGDWVESCSALIEHLDGRFELVHPDSGGSINAMCQDDY